MGRMRLEFTTEFRRRFRERANAKMRRLFIRKLLLFQKNPHDPQLDNHPLDHSWSGCYSFDVEPDWIVIFEKKKDHYLFVTCGDKTRVHRPWLFPGAKPDWEYLQEND